MNEATHAVGPQGYWDFPQVEAWAERIAAAHPAWVHLEDMGRSGEGRRLLLLTLGLRRGDPATRPAFWLDAGTHAAEWAGVMAAVYAVEQWVTRLETDEATRAWFSRHTVYVAPCLSPDGFQAMHAGHPYVRSTLRPARPGEPHLGFAPRDMDGDGAVRWMRWRHHAGPYVLDPVVPLFLRRRTLDDDPEDAFFVCDEGEFFLGAPDAGADKWVSAPLGFGLDLNRNFPGSWAPFEMFGMDAGAYPLSEPESRAAMDAVGHRPNICAALSLHTYTGALLTQPYRKPSPLGEADLDLMERLGELCVSGTGWRVLRTHPDFVYDPDKPIVGVWADTLATVLGIPGYTLEIWDPYAHCGQHVEKPAAFFRKPDDAMVRAVVAAFSEAPHAVVPWRPFDHPQLGPVEIGGLDYMHTVRNPPTAELPTECGKAFRVADQMRRALPEVVTEVRRADLGAGMTQIEVVFENRGFLGTTGLKHGERLVACPKSSVTLKLVGALRCVEGAMAREMPTLDGWGTLQTGPARHPLYPGLPAQGGHREVVSWIVAGHGEAIVEYRLGRGAVGTLRLELS